MITLDEKRCYGATKAELEQLRQSVDYVNQVVASAHFEDQCQVTVFKETNGDTGAQICSTMRSDVTLGVSFYNKWWSKVVGWTVLGRKKNDFVLIHANRKFWRDNNPVENGSNILHELAHGFGYTHQYKPWFESVPYQMNAIYKTVMMIIASELKAGMAANKL